MRLLQRGSGDESSESNSDDQSSAQQKEQPILASLSKVVGDPGLLDAGGVAGQRRRHAAVVRIIPSIPSTAATTSHQVDFIRAVVVHPVVVCAPGGDWAGVHALVAALAAGPFQPSDLAAASRCPAVTNQRLLRSNVTAIYPVLCSQPRVCNIFTNLLLAI